MVLSFITAICSTLFSQDYFDLYSKGALAVELGNYTDIKTSEKIPIVVENPGWILRYIFSHPTAIGFFKNMPGLQQVKVINVNGKNASAEGYELSE